MVYFNNTPISYKKPWQTLVYSILLEHVPIFLWNMGGYLVYLYVQTSPRASWVTGRMYSGTEDSSKNMFKNQAFLSMLNNDCYLTKLKTSSLHTRITFLARIGENQRYWNRNFKRKDSSSQLIWCFVMFDKGTKLALPEVKRLTAWIKTKYN